MSYSVEILPRALRELEEIPERSYRRILGIIDDLKNQPRPAHTLKLKGHEHRWRIRVGDYRILYEVHDSTRSVIVFRILHRKEAYR
jgi:mRNA interferase RelE/StbE